MNRFISTLLALLSAAIFSFAQTTSGLVGHWPFIGNANDQSSLSNDGTTHNVTLTKDRFGRSDSAYYFDGDSAYIDFGGDASLKSSSHTINF